jgi:hypothetical protein
MEYIKNWLQQYEANYNSFYLIDSSKPKEGPIIEK